MSAPLPSSQLERWALERKKALFEETFDLEITIANEVVTNEPV